MLPNESVSVTIVTYNSSGFIKRCLESVLGQTYPFLQVIVVDNNSSDETSQVLEEFTGRCQIIYNDVNVGFAAGQNQAINQTRSDWVLTLNPDMLLLPDFVENLVAAGQQDSSIGTVCGKLLTIKPNFELHDTPRVDSTGIYFTPMLRHLDRGSLEIDEGHYRQPEYVFGATAAAALYRRAMIDDVSIYGEFFDNDFFIYREDADVSWRAQLLGWRCLYTPNAQSYHVRSVLPGIRRTLPACINMHSVKNRFLMRVKNITPHLYWRNFWSITARDAVVVGCCLVREQSSLIAFWHVLRALPRTLAKRREIMRRRRVSDAELESWFAFSPVSRPVPSVSSTIGARLRAVRHSR